MERFFTQVGGSSQPNTPNKIYSGTVQKVHADGRVRVKIPQIGATTDYIRCLNGGPGSEYVVGDRVLCAYIDGRMDEMFVLGRFSFRDTTSENASTEPIGHEDRSDSTMEFKNATRRFTIGPEGSGTYVVWCKGTRFVKTSSEFIDLPNTAGLYFIYFDPSGQLQYRSGYVVDWESDCPTAYVYWNGSIGMLFDERHGVTLDWQTHEYLHRTRGAVIANGLQVSEYLSSNASVEVQNGTFFDEDLQVDIVHSLTPSANTWEQQLQGPARIPVMYRLNTVWTKDAATNYPFKMGATYPLYNNNNGGLWETVEFSNNDHGIMWIVATNMLESPVVAIMGQQVYSNVDDAREQTWEDMDFGGLPLVEMRVLAKIIFETDNTVGSAVKVEFIEISDYRRAMADATSTASAVVSHSDLTDLSADDHPQYLMRVNGSVTEATVSSSVVRNITLSTSPPTGGNDGDVWMVYS